jgi:putative spermidine/putrescine transport system substrate-binding protein
MNRRQFGALTIGAGAGFALSGRARAAIELPILISAAYKKAFDEVVVPRMRDVHGVELQVSTGLSAEALARAIAQKDNPKISFFALDQGPWLQGKQLDLWAPATAAQIPSIGDLYPKYVDPDGLGAAISVVLVGLLYDQAALAGAGVKEPVSFFDMWDPAYKNRVTIPQFENTFAFVTLAETERLLGGDPHASLDKAFARLAELKPNIRTFLGPVGQLVQLFQQKEIWLGYQPHFIWMMAKAAGLSVTWKAPKEGAVAMAHYFGIPKNAPNIEAAYKLADTMLSPEVQKVFGQKAYTGVVNSKTRLDAEFLASFPVTPDAVATAGDVPWDIYQRDRVKLAERWQREIQS